METIERLHVDLGDRGYDILVGPQLIERSGREMLPLMRRRHAVVVSDEIVAGHYLASLRDSLSEAGIIHHSVLLPPGEETKDLAHFGKLAEDILTIGVERGSMLVALGGGVVGDVTGFAAATLLRGIDFVQIPTTLLAQVDSSVGGKTGINTRTGKNLIGAFYQPRLVLADTSVLGSLPRRELLAGYAEIVKYGLIRDAEFFAWLEADGHQVCSLAPEPLRRAVMTSCAMKAEIVAGDEKLASLLVEARIELLRQLAKPGREIASPPWGAFSEDCNVHPAWRSMRRGPSAAVAVAAERVKAARTRTRRMVDLLTQWARPRRR